MTTTTNASESHDPERLLERVDEGVCSLDAEWQFTFVNDNASSLLGEQPEELLGERIWDAVPRVDETDVGAKLREAMETQTPCRFESYNEERERWYKIRIYPSENGVTACWYDITEQHGDRLDSQRQRRLFETVFEETEDALIVADTDRRITDFNPAAERLFGYDAEDVIGETARILYAHPADYEEQGATRFNEQAPERDGTYIIEYERADGTTFTGETFGTSLKSQAGESLAFLGSVRDVSEQVAYEAEIEARNDVLQAFHSITTNADRSIDDQIEAVLELGAAHLGLDTGVVSTIDDDEYTVEYAHTSDGSVTSGDQFPLGETLCEQVVATGELVAAHDVEASELSSHPASVANGRDSYIGTSVIVDGECYGTLNFSDPEPRTEPFTGGERTFVRVLAQWIGKELSRQQTEDRAAASRDRLRQIIDMLPQRVFAKNKDNEYILANKAIADDHDMTVEELEGLTDADLLPPAEAEQLRQDDLAVINSGERKEIREEQLTFDNGETRTFQTTKIPYDPVGHDKEAVLGIATDITEAKQRERELEETTQRLTVALEGTNAGVWELELATDTVIWTDSMEQLFGLEPGSTEGTYEEFLDLIHPDDISAVQDSLQQVSDDGDTLQVEYRIQHDDREKWIEARAELLAGEQTERRLVGIATDITDRKERTAEIELQTAAMEVAMDGIAILDGDEYVYMNQAHADVFDYDPEDLLGCDWRKLYDDEEIERLESEVFPALAETGEWRGETLGRKQDGTPVPQDLGLSLLDSGELICTNRDITAQKEREEELKRQRTRIRALFDNSPDGIIVHDETGAVLDANETTLDELGYDREDLDSLNVAEFEVDIEQSELESVWAEMSPDDVLKVEGEHRRQDGSTFPVEVWVNKFTIDGETQYIAVSRDITEQKHLETSLRESEQSVRELTSIASDTDRDFDEKLTALLELGTERLGLPYGFLNRLDGQTQYVVEATGDHPKLQSGSTAPKSETYCRKTIEQAEPLAIENAAEAGLADDPAYERFDLGCYIGGTVLVDGEEYGTLCFADQNSRDFEFNESERAFVELLVQWISHELASQAFETKLQKINETSQQLMTAQAKEDIGAIAVESARTILEMPMNAVWWYDETADALVPAGETEAAADVVPEQPTFERGEALAWDAFESDEIQVFQNFSDDDEVYNQETKFQSEAIVPFGDYGVMAAASIEPRAFSETDLNLLEVLASTVETALTRAEREAVLRETQRELKRSNEELEQFAYAASHDLQEPLRTVSSYLTLLKRRYGDDLDEDARDFIEFAVDGADRMREMIQALLAYSRVDTRGQAFEPVDTATLFERVTNDLDAKISETEATVSMPSTPVTVLGDQSQLAQLFQNLIDNGIKYNTNTPEIDISVTRDDEMARFAVTDNGIGMEPDQIENIFEVFQRLHTHEEFEGTGIGLSICRKIIERHDGDIQVDSAPGEGSTFVITLPLVSEDND